MGATSVVLTYGADLGSILGGLTVLAGAYIWLRGHLH